MKKLALTFALLLCFMVSIQAQDFSKAIGIRGGYGAEISYQYPLTSTTRAEGDLGLYGVGIGGFTLTGIHQWVFGIQGQDGLNWYVGAGPQIGAVNHSFGIGIAGQIGIEYNVPSVPVQISLDYRPSWFIIPSDYQFAPYGFGLGVRYTF